MLISLIRAVILYFFVIFSVRVMGKRQIGELQPAELVITILISQIVTVPMQDNGFPLINTVIPVCILISLEIIMSVIAMKLPKIRQIISGNPKIIIRDGKIDQNALRQLRLTIDDLMEALRQKDVFDLSVVDYAIIETNGKLSILLNPESQNATSGMVNAVPEDIGLTCTVISDGQIVRKGLTESGIKCQEVFSFLKRNSLNIKEVLLLTTDKTGNFNLVKKDEEN